MAQVGELRETRRKSSVAARFRSPTPVPGEQFSIIVHPHPAILNGPISMVVGGLAVAILATRAGPPPHGPSLQFIWITWSVLLARLIWKLLQWSVEYFVVAYHSHQVLLYSGLVRRKVVARSLINVVDISLHRSIAGRLLGYGELRFESVSQIRPFWTLHYTVYPEVVFDRLYDETFPDRPFEDRLSSIFSR
jgi:hypothetical protein